VRRRRRLLIALAVAAVLFLCCLGGFASFGTYTFIRYKNERDTAAQSLDAYLDDLGDGAFTAAYGRLCTRAQEKESLVEFGRRMSSQPQLANHHLGGVSLLSIRGEEGARVYQIRADENYRDGTTVTRKYQVFVARGGRNPVCPAE
jgi:hypothetical protein